MSCDTESGRPEYLIGGKKAWAARRLCKTCGRLTFPHQIGTTKLLRKLVCKSVMFPKRRRMQERLSMSTLMGSMKTTTSSAYREVRKAASRP